MSIRRSTRILKKCSEAVLECCRLICMHFRLFKLLGFSVIYDKSFLSLSTALIRFRHFGSSDLCLPFLQLTYLNLLSRCSHSFVLCVFSAHLPQTSVFDGQLGEMWSSLWHLKYDLISRLRFISLILCLLKPLIFVWIIPAFRIATCAFLDVT